MKLERYQDKSKKNRKVILISISVILLISVSLLLYKTFASFTESVEFPMMNGKVDYFGNSDVYFAFYNGDKELDTMPSKEDNLEFYYGECDNGASIEWNENEWAPLVKNLSKSKTKCSLYFGEKTLQLDKDIPLVESGDGLYKVEHNDLTELGQEWNKTEYRFGGANPNNYISFNDELWRIIGLVNVQTENGIEQRIKIIRKDNTDGQNNFGSYPFDLDMDNMEDDSFMNGNWTDATLMKILNGVYYKSENGTCFYGENYELIPCDFKNGNVKGINDLARGMIDSDVIWNLGDIYQFNLEKETKASQVYEKERSVSEKGSGYPSLWTKENSPNYHNGIGLIYASDLGYAFGERIQCLNTPLMDGYTYEFDFWRECLDNNWIVPELESNTYWTFINNSYDYSGIFVYNYTQNTDYPIPFYWAGAYDLPGYFVEPTLYLNPTVKIKLDTSVNYGSINNPFQIIS